MPAQVLALEGLVVLNASHNEAVEVEDGEAPGGLRLLSCMPACEPASQQHIMGSAGACMPGCGQSSQQGVRG